MGLDITLARVVNSEVNEYDYLLADDSPELYPFFHHLIRTKHFAYEDEELDAEVYFPEDLAYQRKGVVTAFYNDFVNDVCLIRQHEVDRMLTYVDEKHKAGFDTSFVKQFREGQTVVIISW
ncbi:hypothetical protein [Hymenobacter volaticus]|uniref:Uncharacterized protein n=1 Tax=Hymenobacter volaticus TaxID=2932254 RepID=A0ABY4G1V9_9BACT|nr:hypothetical protein [Hymenobacter volaticus]UOQ64847.1 hypothetical protein MUN86_14890 [Hymenobacter volaticus]